MMLITNFSVMTFAEDFTVDEYRSINFNISESPRRPVYTSTKKLEPTVNYGGNPYVVQIIMKNNADAGTFQNKIKITNASIVDKVGVSNPNHNSQITIYPTVVNYTIEPDQTVRFDIVLTPSSEFLSNNDIHELVEKVIKISWQYEEETPGDYEAQEPIQIGLNVLFTGKYKYGPYVISGLKRNMPKRVGDRDITILQAEKDQQIELSIDDYYDTILKNDYVVFEDFDWAVELKSVYVSDDNDEDDDKIAIALYTMVPIPGLTPSGGSGEYEVQYSTDFKFEDTKGSGTTQVYRIELFENKEVQLNFKYKGSYPRNIGAKWQLNIEEFTDPLLRSEYVDSDDDYYSNNYIRFNANPESLNRSDPAKSDYLFLYDKDTTEDLARLKVEIIRVAGDITIPTSDKPHANKNIQFKVMEGSSQVATDRIGYIKWGMNDEPETSMDIKNPFTIVPPSTGNLKVRVQVDGMEYVSKSMPIVLAPPTYLLEGPSELEKGVTEKYYIYNEATKEQVPDAEIDKITIYDADNRITNQTGNAFLYFTPIESGNYRVEAAFKNTIHDAIITTILVKKEQVEFNVQEEPNTRNVKLELVKPSKAQITVLLDGIIVPGYEDYIVTDSAKFLFDEGGEFTFSVSAEEFETVSKKIDVSEPEPTKAVIRQEEGYLIGEFYPGDSIVNLYYSEDGSFEFPEDVKYVKEGGEITLKKPEKGTYKIVVARKGWKTSEDIAKYTPLTLTEKIMLIVSKYWPYIIGGIVILLVGGIAFKRFFGKGKKVRGEKTNNYENGLPKEPSLQANKQEYKNGYPIIKPEDLEEFHEGTSTEKRIPGLREEMINEEAKEYNYDMGHPSKVSRIIKASNRLSKRELK